LSDRASRKIGIINSILNNKNLIKQFKGIVYDQFAISKFWNLYRLNMHARGVLPLSFTDAVFQVLFGSQTAGCDHVYDLFFIMANCTLNQWFSVLVKL